MRTTPIFLKNIYLCTAILASALEGNSQFLSHVQVGVHLASLDYISSYPQSHFTVGLAPAIELQTPFHVGHVLMVGRVFHAQGIVAEQNDFNVVSTMAYWMLKKEVFSPIEFSLGMGVGAEVYVIDEGNGRNRETEMQFGVRSELSYRFRQTTVLATVEWARVFLFQRMDYMAYGVAIRRQFTISSKVRDAIR